MVEKARRRHHFEGLHFPNIPIEIKLSVPGLLGDTKKRVERFDNERGLKVVTNEIEHNPGNLERKLPDVACAIAERNGLSKFIDEVRRGDKKAIYIISAVGTLTIFTASALTFEFGVREGKDFKELVDRLDEWAHHARQDPEKRESVKESVREKVFRVFGRKKKT